MKPIDAALAAAADDDADDADDVDEVDEDEEQAEKKDVGRAESACMTSQIQPELKA